MKNGIILIFSYLFLSLMSFNVSAEPSLEETVKWINKKAPLICHAGFKYKTYEGKNITLKRHYIPHINPDTPSLLKGKLYVGNINGKKGWGAAVWEDVFPRDLSQVDLEDGSFKVQKVSVIGGAYSNGKNYEIYKWNRGCFSDSYSQLERLSKALRHLTKLIQDVEPF